MKCTVIHAVLYDVILSISSSFALVPYRQVSRVFDDEASESDAGMRAYEGFASLLFRLLLSHLNQFSIVFFFLIFLYDLYDAVHLLLTNCNVILSVGQLPRTTR